MTKITTASTSLLKARPTTAPNKLANVRRRAKPIAPRAAAPAIESGRLVRTDICGHDGVRTLVGPRGASYLLADPHASGAFGRVSYACDARGAQLIAKEVYTEETPESANFGLKVMPRDRAAREIDIARAVPNTLNIVAAVQTPDRLVQVMELMDGDWKDAVDSAHAQGFSAQEKQAMALESFHQGAATLHSFHSQSPVFVHGDVKLENFLWSKDHGMRWGDYGISAAINPMFGAIFGRRGTPLSMAPETYTPPGIYDAQAEMWSLGVFAGESIVGSNKSPFRRGVQDGLPPPMRMVKACAKIVNDAGNLSSRRLEYLASMPSANDMESFLGVWHKADSNTCRFAVERLFTDDPTRRATSAETASFARGLIAQRPEHATGLKSSLTKLAGDAQKRTTAFASLRKRIGLLEPSTVPNTEETDLHTEPQVALQTA